MVLEFWSCVILIIFKPTHQKLLPLNKKRERKSSDSLLLEPLKNLSRKAFDDWMFLKFWLGEYCSNMQTNPIRQYSVNLNYLHVRSEL